MDPILAMMANNIKILNFTRRPGRAKVCIKLYRVDQQEGRVVKMK